jgi:hypothetical protein
MNFRGPQALNDKLPVMRLLRTYRSLEVKPFRSKGLTTPTGKRIFPLLRLPGAHVSGPLHYNRLEFTNDFTVSN